MPETRPRTPKRIGWRIVLACAACLTGAFLVVRGMARFRPAPRHSPPSTHESGATPAPSRPLAEADWLPASADELRAGVRAAVAQASVPLRSPLHDEIAQSAAEYVAVIWGGSYEDYREYIDSRGGKSLVDLTAPGVLEGDRTFFASVTEPYRGQPLGLGAITVRPRVLGAITVRPRVLGGRTMPIDHAGRMKVVTAPGRYPALDPVAYNTDEGHVIIADTYEVLIPIRHSFRGHDSTILLGLWHTRSPVSGRWLLSRIVTYSSPGETSPVITPPL